MKNFNSNISLLTVLAAFTIIYSCSPADKNNTGHEYMPDMGHSIAYEANVVDPYSPNHWEKESTKSVYDLSVPRLPVAGTVARGSVGIANQSSEEGRTEMVKMLRGDGNSSVALPINGSVPYYYKDTEEERTRAMAEIVKNPFLISKESLRNGKELYTIYCGLCHGDKGDGNGFLYDHPEAKYPAKPANLVSDDFIASSEGRYYHAIMFGKNVMGSYADKLSYTERWNVIQYIRSLQANAKGLKYNDAENTLNNSATPALSIVKLNKAVEEHAEIKMDHPAGH